MSLLDVQAALGTLQAAIATCKAVGFDPPGPGYPAVQLFEETLRRAEVFLQEEERFEVPLKPGDLVRIRTNSRRNADHDLPVLRVGRTKVYCQLGCWEKAFRLEDGQEGGDYNRECIDPVDLRRIKRDLVGRFKK